MEPLSSALSHAVRLIVTGDRDLYSAVATSLQVSLTATAIATIVGAPLGTLLAVSRFTGRRMVLVFSSALMGIPPVVVGLIVYLLLSRAGPLGDLGLLFTRQAMVMAQVLLTFPIVVVLTYRVTSESWQSHGDALRIDGAKAVRCAWALLHMNGTALVTVFLAAFGRAIAEVGAIVLVGGNIRGDTRTMTTAIALETAKGELAVAMGLGIILLTLIVLVSAAVYEIERRLPR
jgi:tungstate transport system permease protein